jgi:hypothetical protein
MKSKQSDADEGTKRRGCDGKKADEAQALINRPSNRARRATEALAESSARKLSGPAGG